MMPDFPDPYVPFWIEHGSQRLRTERPRVQSRSREIDTGTVSYQDERPDVYQVGSCLDGYPTMPIVERDPRPDGPVYQYRLQFEGLPPDEPWRELNFEEDLPEENFDTINVTIYTREPADARWRKGARVQAPAALYDVSGDSATSKLAYAEHGLVTGQIALVDFSAGFGGLTTGGTYYVARLNANQFYLSMSRANAFVAGVTAPAAPHSITGSMATSRISWVAHGRNDGDVVTFPTLTGGAGLTAATVPYYVVNKTTDDFQVSLTPGGSAVAFTSSISAGTCQPGSAIFISSDGTGMTLRYVLPGYESCWIVERRKRKARAAGYWEIDLQYKGIKLGDDDSKPVKRRISTTTQTVTNDKFPGAIASNVYLGFPPELVGTALFGAPIPPGYQPAELDLPQIAVTDVFVSDQPPPTSLVPGNWIPADAPAIRVINPFSDAYTYHWPAGWKVLNLQSEQIPGQPLWFISITWGYQIPTSPRTSTDA